MKTRSKTYNSTVTNDSEGLKTIAAIRSEVKVFNLEQKILSIKDSSHIRMTKKVALFGRLGKNNPNSDVYRNKVQSYGAGNYQRISIEHAVTIDVYVTTFKTGPYGLRSI